MSCELYDYLEIACMFHYLVRISLIDGAVIEGRAHTIAVDKQKNETLILHSIVDDKHSNQPNCIEIQTKQVAEMHVLTANARFTSVKFK